LNGAPADVTAMTGDVARLAATRRDSRVSISLNGPGTYGFSK